jgi:hypothetical protein
VFSVMWANLILIRNTEVQTTYFTLCNVRKETR